MIGLGYIKLLLFHKEAYVAVILAIFN